jgi:hypothetical protein
MFDELVGGVGEIAGTCPSEIGGEILDGSVEAGVSIAFGEMRD